MKNNSEIRRITRRFQFTIPQGFRNNNDLKSLFKSQPKDQFFDTKSEKEIMKIVNKEIKSSRKQKKS